MFHLTHKQLLELKYWFSCDMLKERQQLDRCFPALGLPVPFEGPFLGHVLEIGTGPHWGLLPFLHADFRFAIDPLFPAYEATGILAERGDIRRVDECFEHWDTAETFDLIVTTNALDHGEMGFHLLPKIWRMLKPGGSFHAHVHLRPKELLNLLHDHALTLEQLEKHLSYTDLVQEKFELMPHDFDEFPSPTLIGVWRKPL